MPRFKMKNGVRVQLSPAEEAARDAEETAADNYLISDEYKEQKIKELEKVIDNKIKESIPISSINTYYSLSFRSKLNAEGKDRFNKVNEWMKNIWEGTFLSHKQKIENNEEVDFTAVVSEISAAPYQFEDIQTNEVVVNAPSDSQFAFDAFDSVGNQEFRNSPITLNINQIRYISDFITINNDSEIEVNDAFSCFIIFKTATNIKSGGSRSTSTAWLERRLFNGVWAEVNGFRGFMYNRNSQSGHNDTTVFGYLDLNAGDRLRIRLERYSGGGTIVTIPSTSSFSIIKTDGA